LPSFTRALAWLKNLSPRKISGPRFNPFFTQSRDPQAEIGENLNPFLHRVWLVDYGIAAAITKKKLPHF
jgi:hypothetical protein